MQTPAFAPHVCAVWFEPMTCCFCSGFFAQIAAPSSCCQVAYRALCKVESLWTQAASPYLCCCCRCRWCFCRCGCCRCYCCHCCCCVSSYAGEAASDASRSIATQLATLEAQAAGQAEELRELQGMQQVGSCCSQVHCWRGRQGGRAAVRGVGGGGGEVGGGVLSHRRPAGGRGGISCWPG